MRLDALRQRITERELDGMLITDPLNRRYLTGFSGSAGWVLVTPERAMLAVDFRYYERAAHEAPGWEQVRVSTTWPAVLAEMVAQAGIKTLGIEAENVTLALFDEWRAKVPGVAWKPVQQMVMPMRMVKEESEIETMRKAVACADAAFAHLCQIIRPGMTEAQIAWELESYMRLNGAEEVGFPIIVGSGPNGAMPHATSSDRPVQVGEPIVIDWGATVHGYRSDATRTLCLGTADEQYLRTWNLVRDAQRAVEEGVRPGMSGKEVDALARDVLAKAGQAERFGHGLGHGVGLAIHEAPFMGPRVEQVILEPGMVFSIEPGLYYPGWGGVRIEDLAVLREHGAEVLTQAPKEPTVVG